MALAQLGQAENKSKVITEHITPAHLGWAEKCKTKKPCSSSPGLGRKTKQNKTEHFLHEQNPLQPQLHIPL